MKKRFLSLTIIAVSFVLGVGLAENTYAVVSVATNENIADESVYVFKRGDGKKLINRGSKSDLNIDILNLENINYDDCDLTFEGFSLIITVKDTGDSITIKDYLRGDSFDVSEINFNDGKTLSYYDVYMYCLTNLFNVEGTAGDEILDYSDGCAMYSIHGREGNDIIKASTNICYLYGDEGNDILYGGPGDDVLDGGTGNDILYSGIQNGCQGKHTYIFGRGYGQDIIKKVCENNCGDDVLKLKDINKDDVELSKSGNDLIVKVKDSNDSMTIERYFEKKVYAVSTIEFQDGTSTSYDEINN